MSEQAIPLPVKKKGKLKPMLIAGVGGIVLIGGGVAGGIYASGGMHKGKEVEEEDPNRPHLMLKDGSEHGKEATGPEPKGRPDPTKYQSTYFELETNFTSNLHDTDGFVQLGLGVSTFYDERVIENIKKDQLPIRSAVLMTLASQDAFVITTPEGKKALQKQLTDAINGVLEKQEGFGGVDDVYFTSFIIQ